MHSTFGRMQAVDLGPALSALLSVPRRIGFAVQGVTERSQGKVGYSGEELGDPGLKAAFAHLLSVAEGLFKCPTALIASILPQFRV
jgi:hypothetical protein